MVRRASDADMDAVLAFAAQIFADEQDIPKELNFIPADKQPQWVHGAGRRTRRHSGHLP